MNSKILFRGKRKDNNEWCFGQLVFDKDKIPFIVEEVERYNCDGTDDLYAIMWYEVFPETIGQYINRLDRENEKIFEGCRCKFFIRADFLVAPEGIVEYLDDRWILRYNEHSYVDFQFINSKDILIMDNILDKEVN